MVTLYCLLKILIKSSIFTIDFEYYLSQICVHTISQIKNVKYIVKRK